MIRRVRTVVDSVPTLVLVLVVVGVVVGLVLLSVWAVRRLLPETRDGFDAEVSSQMLGVVASLFGLLLAFVVVIEFQAFTSAGATVSAEANGLAAIVRDSHAFPFPVELEYRNPEALATLPNPGQTITLEPNGTGHVEVEVPGH